MCSTPEIPVLTIADLGILREVVVRDDGHVDVAITPTYSGCPAMDALFGQTSSPHSPRTAMTTSRCAPRSPRPGRPTGSPRPAGGSSRRMASHPRPPSARLGSRRRDPGFARSRFRGPGRVSAVRIHPHSRSEPVRLDGVQGAVPLLRLRGALRLLQAAVSEQQTRTPASAGARKRASFHLLKVAELERITDDAVAITFDVPADLRARSSRSAPVSMSRCVRPSPPRRPPAQLLHLRAGGVPAGCASG